MNLIKWILRKLALSDLAWNLFSPLIRSANFMEAERNAYISSKHRIQQMSPLDNKFLLIFRDRHVLHGPFKGMRYPGFTSSGSTLYPKLMGSYERELHSAIESICKTEYSEIINIGCGEGYYAVGLAMRLPSAKIFAFDTDPEAVSRTQEMARINKVENQLITGSFCTTAFLRDFNFMKKGLIICDCEGYEKSLFDESIDRLTNCDLLIETHDFIDLSISTKLINTFGPSHRVESILSIDDITKAKSYNFPEAVGLDLAERKELYKEGRPTIMEWLFLTANHG